MTDGRHGMQESMTVPPIYGARVLLRDTFTERSLTRCRSTNLAVGVCDWRTI
ncbi:hypothetical protein ACFY36_20300 [Actinoplanes sp. NPDC000266]